MSLSKASVAFLFDLDGTLVDSVYQHVLAWRDAFDQGRVPQAAWRIHRCIGMGDELLVATLLRDLGHPIDKALGKQLKNYQTESYLRRATEIRPFPGSRPLLDALSDHDVPWAIATSNTPERARSSFEMLGLDDKVPVVTREDVAHGKPDPDLFIAGAKLLKRDPAECIVVGDSPWDLLAAQRCKALSIGLLCGGFSRQELVEAGAYRIYSDPTEMLSHLDEVGVRLTTSERG